MIGAFQSDLRARPARVVPGFRWWIAGLLLLASVLNYLDRNTLSVLAPTIQKDLGLSDQQYAHIVSLFMVAYAVAYLGSGWVVDRLGPRLALALFVGGWSLANALTGLARGFTSLACFRFLLGLGEAGGYTASPKVVSEWFPARDRGVAVGMYSVGGALGAAMAPVLVIPLASQLGWRSVFAVTPLFGLTFAALWLWLYRRPEAHAWLGPAERELILSGRSKDSAEAEALGGRPGWGRVVRHPAVWALMGARLLTDPVWYFLQFWLPKYLSAERHLEQTQLARIWLVYLAADAGFLASGYVSGWFVRRGCEPLAARRRVLLGAAGLVPLAPLIVWQSSVTGALLCAALVAAAHTAWLASLSTYVVDLVPRPILATAFGLIAAGSALGGILMNEAVGWIVTHHSYTPCFWAMVALHPAGFGLLWSFARQPWAAADSALAPRAPSSF